MTSSCNTMDLYDDVDQIVSLASGDTEPDVIRRELSGLQNKIKQGEMPPWMLTALDDTQSKFPAGSSISLPIQHQQRRPARIQRGRAL